MKKTIEKSVENKVFSKKDILRLSNKLWAIYEDSENEFKHYKVKLFCENNLTLEVENDDFSKRYHEVLDEKKIERIDFSFTEYNPINSIDISLTHGSDSWKKQISISGNDHNWVDRNNITIDEYIDSISPQNEKISRYAQLLTHFVAINLGYIVIVIGVFLLNKIGYKPPEVNTSSNPFFYAIDFITNTYKPFEYLLYILIGWATGIGTFFGTLRNLNTKISELWPSIELDFGPSHKRTSKNGRKTILSITTLVIIPMIINTIFLFLSNQT